MNKPANPLRVCRYCRFFGEWRGNNVLCGLNERVCAQGMGCVMFERAPGTDDDLSGRYPQGGKG